MLGPNNSQPYDGSSASMDSNSAPFPRFEDLMSASQQFTNQHPNDYSSASDPEARTVSSQMSSNTPDVEWTQTPESNLVLTAGHVNIASSSSDEYLNVDHEKQRRRRRQLPMSARQERQSLNIDEMLTESSDDLFALSTSFASASSKSQSPETQRNKAHVVQNGCKDEI